METLFPDPSEYHVGSWPWDDILKKHIFINKNLYTNSELLALQKIIYDDPDYTSGQIKENTINNQFRYYIGLWLVDNIKLSLNSQTIELHVKIKSEPKLQRTISFFKKQTSLSDEKIPTIVYCSEFYAQRVCPADMSVIIK